jgi:hypothetical protein
VLDKRGLAGQHIFEHIRREVETHTRVGEDGKVHGRPRWTWDTWPVEGLFVHPRTKLLCYEARSRYRRPKGETDFRRALSRFFVADMTLTMEIANIRIDSRRLWRKQGDHWFIHFYEPAPPGEIDGQGRYRWIRAKQAGKRELWAARDMLARPPF